MPTSFQISSVDAVAIVAYVLVIVGIGFVVSRKDRDTEDYFLAGRALTWPLVGFSLFASNISSSTLVGLAGGAYATGIAVYNYEWMAVVVLVVFVLFILPFYLRTQVYTMPEFLELRYDARSRFAFAGLSVVSYVVIDISGTLYAGALVVQLIYPDVPMWFSVTTIAVIAGLYTTVGGLRAVVYTDFLQAILLFTGAAVVAWIAFERVGSWDAVTAVTPPEMLSLIQAPDSDGVPWPGLLTGVILLGFYYWCTNQQIVQRALGAKSLLHGRWGALFAGLLKIPVIFIMVLPGTFARVLYPDLASPDLVFPTLTFDLLPGGLRGLVLVAFAAALMSSIDSTLNAASTIVTIDFVRRLRPATPERRLVWIGRFTTILLVVLAALVAPQIVRFASLWTYLQAGLAYLTPPIVALFVLGLFWKRANGDGAIAAFVVGIGVGGVLLVVQPGLHFLYVATLLFAVSVAVHITVSLLTPTPQARQVVGLVWRRDMFREDGDELRALPWYQNYRVHCAVLLLLVAGVVALFW